MSVRYRCRSYSFFGACIVTGSVVALGVRKWRKEAHAVAQPTAPVADLKVVEVEPPLPLLSQEKLTVAAPATEEEPA